MPKIQKNNILDPLEITSDSYTELSFRVKMAMDAVMLYHYFGQGLTEVYPESNLDETPEYMARNIVTQFAFIQMSAIFDGSGKYSLHVQDYRNKIHVTEKRLRNLFPIFNDTELKVFVDDLNQILLKHQKSINIIFGTRNEKIGHLGKKIYKIRESEDYAVFSHGSQIPNSFRYKRIMEICHDLSEVLLDEVQNRLEFGDLWLSRAECKKRELNSRSHLILACFIN